MISFVGTPLLVSLENEDRYKSEEIQFAIDQEVFELYSLTAKEVSDVMQQTKLH